MLKYSSTTCLPCTPKRLTFGVLSAKEVERQSVVQVTSSQLYYRGLPASGGLLDPLLGTVDRRHLCATCRRDAQTCQGHSGHIALAYPVYHIGFLDCVLKTLRTTCFACSRVVATDEEKEAVLRPLQGKARLLAAHALLRGRKACPFCAAPRPSYSRHAFGVQAEWAADAEWEGEEERAYCTSPFTSREALSILTHMSDDDAEWLGFDARASHPRNMVLQNLVVPPVNTRPAIYTSEGSRSRGQNDLTHHLLEILKRSHEMEAFLAGASWRDAVVTPELVERLHRLQYEVFALVNNNLRIQKPQGMGRAGSSANAKSIVDRLKGKEGRVRGNLMGKRVDFSARCVITPDPYFDCDRVGVPYHIAQRLTVPETVNPTNIRRLSERVKRGAKDVHGADSVILTTGEVVSLANCAHRADLVLKNGDVVERFLADDDVVVFNRQPSLHLHGMQAHRVRLMPGYTFRLSLVVASPYNADFDGDEMNLHVPQSPAAIAECSALMAVAQNCVGAQSNKPVLGIVQDSLLGLHVLSHLESTFDRSHFCRCLGSTRHWRRVLPPPCIVLRRKGEVVRRVWSGKQMISCLLPRGLYVEPEREVAWGDEERLRREEDLPVVVRDGQLLSGVLRKAHVGTAAGGIVDVLCREMDGVAALRFMGDAQRLTNAFLLQRGHHVGIEDVMLSAEGQERVTERLSKASRLCEDIQREMEGAPPDVAKAGEGAIMRLLSKMLMQTGGIVNEHMSRRNSIRRMVTAGSKGSFINLSQICACLGQQSLEGARLRAEKGDRLLPCFAPHDLSLASRGMVYNSFALGLSPSELFCHAVGGREGLVDTSVKTSQTGYLQRRMNKAMEDHRVFPDGTVRNAMSEVVSFRWGSDSMHPAKLERVRLEVLFDDEQAVRARHSAPVAEEVLRLRELVLRTKRHVLAAEVDARVLLPFHPGRLMRKQARLKGSPSSSVSREHAEARVGALVEGVVSLVVRLALWHVFAHPHVDGMAVADFDAMLEATVAKVRHASNCVGDSVGCLAAQSVGEPCTQLTLNTFHTAGCSIKNVTLGIPRMKELCDASKTPKTPCTTVRFRRPFASSARFARYFAETLPQVRLGDVVSSCDIVHDPDPFSTSVEAHRDFVEVERLLGDHPPEEGACEYVVHLHLHKEAMRARHLTPPLVRAVLRERLGERALVMSSEVNSVEWVVHVRYLHVREMARVGGLTLEQQSILCHKCTNVLLDTVVLGGHPDVTGADAAEAPRFDEGDASEHVVHAYGNVLVDCAASESVEWERCTSNDVWEVLHTLGVEACVHVFFDQLKSVVSFDGTYVDDRHLMMVADTVCRGGTLMPLNRHGINRTDASPLMRCSFEETCDVLCESAMFAETENGKGVSTSIMTGQMADFGTGGVEVLFPASSFPKQAPSKTRVLRSTCRSHTASRRHEEVLEYVMEGAKTCVPPRSLSPPPSDDDEEPPRRRARFRNYSPPRGGPT